MVSALHSAFRMVTVAVALVIPAYAEAGPGRRRALPVIASDPAQAASGALESALLDPFDDVPIRPRGATLAAPARRGHRLTLGDDPGEDVQVNDPSGDTPEYTTQNEVSVAVRGSTVCAAFNDTGAGREGWSSSTDRGTDWTDGGDSPRRGDPVLAVHHASGKFYYADLVLITAASPDDLEDIVQIDVGLLISTDDCATFTQAVDPSPEDLADHLHDKPWIAVDNTGGPRDGHVYMCWSRFVHGYPGPATGGEIRFSRSTDQGSTFGDEQVVSSGDSFPFGCQVEVGPMGEVYLAWVDRGSHDVRFIRSLDGGLQWDDAVTVNSRRIRPPGTDRVITCGSAQRLTLNGDIRMLDQVWMAGDSSGGPFTGNIYLVWAHDPPGSTDNSDVRMSRSTDGGSKWEPDVDVGGGTLTDQFEPFVEVGGDGALALAWYDRRNDPANNFLIDVYGAMSRDGGRTLDPIERITDVSFAVPPLTGQPTRRGNFDPRRFACYMGEYIGIAADAERFYYAWGDNRNTVVSSVYPNGRPDPDVYFDWRRVPLVSTPNASASPTPSVTPPPPRCVGDCDGSGDVTVDEIVIGVNIALGNRPITDCPEFDSTGDGAVSIDELIIAVSIALAGCAAA